MRRCGSATGKCHGNVTLRTCSMRPRMACLFQDEKTPKGKCRIMFRKLLPSGLLLFVVLAQIPCADGQTTSADASGKNAPSTKDLANKPIAGSLTLGGKTYNLASVAIYETTVFDQ